MPKPGEHKTVQSRILTYAQEIGWTFVPRGEAEMRRGFDAGGGSGSERAARASLYFDTLLYEKVREFNPLYREAEGALTGRMRRLQANIFGNREFLALLRNQGKFFCAEENSQTSSYSPCSIRTGVVRASGGRVWAESRGSQPPAGSSPANRSGRSRPTS